jgi:uncharacterized membrane protein
MSLSISSLAILLLLNDDRISGVQMLLAAILMPAIIVIGLCVALGKLYVAIHEACIKAVVDEMKTVE